MTRLNPGCYDRLAGLGLVLPAPPVPVANFVAAVREGALVFLSGQGPVFPGGAHCGRVGGDVTAAQARDHARLVGLNLLSVLHAELGDLGAVTRIVKLFGMVNATADFTGHPGVIDGCSDLLVSVFGAEVGRHARSAVGMGSLPGNITVEIDLVVAVA